MDQQKILSDAQIDEFSNNGVLIIKNFYDLNKEILPIQKAIHSIIGILITKNGLSIDHPHFSPATFDAGFQKLIAANRFFGSEVYTS